MLKKTIRDAEIAGRTVLLRVDFNVPLRDGKVADHQRLQASIPTLKALAEAGCRILCASHLGRPKGTPQQDLSLEPVAHTLSRLLASPVFFVPTCHGPEVREKAAGLAPGEILVLENLRFDPGEESNDPAFAGELAAPASVYVNDAFGTAHRAHASTVAVTRFLRPALAGLLMEKEIHSLSRLHDRSRKPYVAILGGAKISGKIELIEQLLERADRLVVGGAMAYTLLRARGVPTGGSLVEEDLLETAAAILEKAEQRQIPMLLPVDHVIGSSLSDPAPCTTPGAAIPAGMMAADIGPRTAEVFARAVADAAMVIWNGPMGVFEHAPYAAGTRRVAEAVAGCPGFTVVGGGDSAAAVHAFGLAGRFGHVSTGGGATLEFISGRTLPGLEALDDAREETE